jgi:hypothetical protein
MVETLEVCHPLLAGEVGGATKWSFQPPRQRSILAGNDSVDTGRLCSRPGSRPQWLCHPDQRNGHTAAGVSEPLDGLVSARPVKGLA